MPRIKKFNKKRFTGNIYTRKPQSDNSDGVNTGNRLSEEVEDRPRPKLPIPDSSSSKKLRSLRLCGETSDYVKDRMTEGNVFIDISTIQRELLSAVQCKMCSANDSLELCENTTKRQGISSSLELTCNACNFKTSFMTSPKTTSGYYENNLRLVYAFRSIGKGQKPAAIFSSVMNLPPPPKKFYRYNKIISNAIEDVANQSMTNAARDAVAHNDNDSDIGAMFDGTWQKRGHSSLNGIMTVSSIDNGKILDLECLTKYCFVCKGRNSMGHDGCHANYSGSSGAMEVAGAKSLFERSMTRPVPVRYVQYLGDGDSKAFQSIVDSKPYGPDVQISKLECIGHVQKRMGTRLRKLKESYKKKVCSDKKPLSGKGRLTQTLIDQLQRYYGNAIRANVTNLDSMKDATWATYWHKCSTDEEPSHGVCPKGIDSWCKQNRAIAANLPVPPHQNSVPKAVMETIKPIYEDLCNPSLLKKCLHGKTQNQNESFNNLIWTRLPKNVFVRLDTLKIGAYDALICFNEGSLGKVKVLEMLCGKAGLNTVVGLKFEDQMRVYHAKRAMEDIEKRARQSRRHVKRKLEDNEEAEDDVAYSPGAF